MFLHKIYYFTAPTHAHTRRDRFFFYFLFYCFVDSIFGITIAKNSEYMRMLWPKSIQTFGISFYAQISNDFYVQQIL